MNRYKHTNFPFILQTLSGTQVRIFSWWDNDFIFLNPYMKFIVSKDFFPLHAATEVCIWSQLNFDQYRSFWSSVREITELCISHDMDDIKDFCVFNKYCTVKHVVSSSVLEGILSFPVNSTCNSTLYHNYGRCKYKEANVISNQTCEYCPVASFLFPLCSFAITDLRTLA